VLVRRSPIVGLSLATALSLLIGSISVAAQPPPPPEAPPPAAEEPKPATPAPETAEPPVAAESSEAAAADAAAEAQPPAPAATPAAESDDDFDLEGFATDDGPKAAGFVMPDFDRPQPTGIERLEHHDHRWMWHNLTAIRVNPLGVTNRFRTGYQMQLSHRNEAIFEESYASAQLDTEITPAFGYVGGRLEVQPVKLFNFWGSYGVVGSFGSFSHTRSFASALDHHPDDLLSDTRDQDYSSVGHKAVLSGMFQIGIGGLAMRDNFKGHWRKQDLAEGDNVFWDASLDVLYPNDGWVITNDADLLAITDWDLIIGLRYTFTHAIYRHSHLGPGARNINTPHHRVGPALIYTFFDDGPGTMWNKPTLVLLTQWWAGHRYRTGDKPMLPYIVLAFVQQGDFMISELE